MEPKNDAPEVIETQEPVVETVETPEESPEDKITRLETEKAELEEKNKKLFARAKAAETKKVETPVSQGQYSLADMRALDSAKVHEDDVERVERFAKSEGVSIKDALKNPELKAILSVREDNRTSAQASNVSSVRRAPVNASDESLVESARSGKIPEDEGGIARLVSARMKIR